MNLEGLHAFVDQYAHTAVSHLFLCPNAMKASHRSKVRDAIWELKDGQKPPQEEFAKKWCENARLLDERGLDPYAVWIARCREKEISPWLSMRMNDVHNADDVDNYIHSSFWRKHPDYWRVPGGSGWTDRALDYGIPKCVNTRWPTSASCWNATTPMASSWTGCGSAITSGRARKPKAERN